MSDLINKLQNEGFFLNDEGKRYLEETEETPNGLSLEKAKTYLGDTDISGLCSKQLPDTGTLTGTLKGPLVVQINEIVNITEPLIRQTSNSGGTRMLRVIVTDGVVSFKAIEFKGLSNLSLDTPPGTKVQLSKVPIRNGILLLEPSNTKVLGGRVQTLVENWEQVKRLSLTRTTMSSDDPPPPFKAFQAKQASSRTPAPSKVEVVKAAAVPTQPLSNQHPPSGRGRGISQESSSQSSPSNATPQAGSHRGQSLATERHENKSLVGTQETSQSARVQPPARPSSGRGRGAFQDSGPSSHSKTALQTLKSGSLPLASELQNKSILGTPEVNQSARSQQPPARPSSGRDRGAYQDSSTPPAHPNIASQRPSQAGSLPLAGENQSNKSILGTPDVNHMARGQPDRPSLGRGRGAFDIGQSSASQQCDNRPLGTFERSQPQQPSINNQATQHIPTGHQQQQSTYQGKPSSSHSDRPHAAQSSSSSNPPPLLPLPTPSPPAIASQTSHPSSGVAHSDGPSQRGGYSDRGNQRSNQDSRFSSMERSFNKMNIGQSQVQTGYHQPSQQQQQQYQPKQSFNSPLQSDVIGQSQQGNNQHSSQKYQPRHNSDIGQSQGNAGQQTPPQSDSSTSKVMTGRGHQSSFQSTRSLYSDDPSSYDRSTRTDQQQGPQSSYRLNNRGGRPQSSRASGYSDTRQYRPVSGRDQDAYQQDDSSY
mmetsp:Transcript_23727/g.39026  ORF Transcript_23727/g.39026 Transcript_23727/m.39026 type:complete len:706 (+) Transcript_23727:167-2284(+)|eukprot:CAMPEP_0184661640 /NCGR_PEP_ID=MMETSP0308-20130426/39380_1 /TAXON_ID=38269 /ORGANISM="Gloeochaete witrockiana, Strain SAG 46.84" /LENGTH=705 /DNA_ID=CAMNT_0027103085 /DNA_START=88 /DNA_END=2205 /DNA_ORIENTATION=+